VRPGGKLFEELGFEAEKMDKTGHEKIYIGRLTGLSFSRLRRATKAARPALEVSMQLPDNYEFQFPPLRRAQLKGKAEGNAEALLRVLSRRGIEVSAESRDKILSCTDVERLCEWFDRALEAGAIEDVFLGA